MGQTSVAVPDQVREVVEAVVDALGEPKEDRSPAQVATSVEADTLRGEILRVGRKLWERQYVDGNGGNISVRIGANYVLCSPTMMSKGDLQMADICMVDLEGNVLAGDRARTSELLLHLEIYKANPKARAVVHCHPPYATAYAMTGTVPPNGLISEYELFIGPAAMAPYETPGTQAFAETVLPFVEKHNTILLQNHGIVCWSDTVTHAEYLCEIIDTYCKTYLIARQIGAPLTLIPEDKIQEILALKRRWGLPDARMTDEPETVVPGADLEELVAKVQARLEGR